MCFAGVAQAQEARSIEERKAEVTQVPKVAEKKEMTVRASSMPLRPNRRLYKSNTKKVQREQNTTTKEKPVLQTSSSVK